MRVLDLFSGLGGWAEPFRDRGHEVITLDNDPRFGCDITTDVRDFHPSTLPWRPDVVVASPPCERFSTLTFQRGYFRMIDGQPRAVTPEGHEAVGLVRRTWAIITDAHPTFYVIENPRALLRRLMPQMMTPTHERRTVWYCHLGSPVAKPTDLWGRFPESFSLPPSCHNRRPEHPRGCCCLDHNPAPRGSRTGTQGEGSPGWTSWSGDRHDPDRSALRAKVPYRLGELLAIAAERDL